MAREDLASPAPFRPRRPAEASKSTVRLALPSKGLEQETLDFLNSCGLLVHRPNPRQYTATVFGLPEVVALFQRAADIYAKVDEGSADLGITGLDVVREQEREGSEALILCGDLGYGHCSLVLAVPESWIDVTTLGDLAELAALFKAQGRELRVATKYANLTQQFLYQKGINYFTLVEAGGAVEAAPRMGYADFIADIVETGTTLKDNALKPLRGGMMLKSQACLIGNRRLLREDGRKLAVAKTLLELMEARLRAQKYYSVTANIKGASAEEIAHKLTGERATAGLRGPTIAPVHPKGGGEEGWYAATVVVPAAELLAAVDHLRRVGAASITVLPVEYLFEARSASYEALLAALKKS